MGVASNLLADSGNTKMASGTSTEKPFLSTVLNEMSASRSHINEYKDVDKTELVNLMLQAMIDLGMDQSVKTLKKEAEGRFMIDSDIADDTSGKSEVVEAFIAEIENGDYAAALSLVPELPLRDDLDIGIVSEASIQIYKDIKLLNSSTNEPVASTLTQVDKDKMQNLVRYYIHRAQFIETLVIQKIPEKSLQILRSDLQRPEFLELPGAESDINELSTLIINESAQSKFIEEKICESFQELTKQESDGQRLLRGKFSSQLLKCIIYKTSIPEHRLLTMLHQARKYQERQNLLVLKGDTSCWSLYSDYKFPIEKFPCKITKNIKYNQETWYVKFSNNGKFLAVTTKGPEVLIFKVGNFGSNFTNVTKDVDFQLYTVLSGHKESVIYCSWSPDDKQLITSSFDTTVKFWDLETGKCLKSMTISPRKRAEDPSPTTTAARWFPNGKGFVLGSSGKQLAVFDENYEETFRFSVINILDLCITADSSKIIAVGDKRLVVFDVNSKQKIRDIHLGKKVNSITLSKKNNDHVLVNMLQDYIQLWDWNSLRLVKTFVGQRQHDYVIRSGFGGVDEELVVSGSEDGKIYMWNSEYAALILALEGHKKLSNCVDFNPKIPWMFASGSDDRTLKIWGPSEVMGQVDVDMILKQQ